MRSPGRRAHSAAASRSPRTIAKRTSTRAISSVTSDALGGAAPCHAATRPATSRHAAARSTAATSSASGRPWTVASTAPRRVPLATATTRLPATTKRVSGAIPTAT